MRRIGYYPGTDTPCHGTILEDLAWLTECTLATIEELQMKSRPPKSELRRQRRIATFGVSAVLEHGPGKNLDLVGCGRVQKIIDDHCKKSGALVMPWDEEGADAS